MRKNNSHLFLWGVNPKMRKQPEIKENKGTGGPGNPTTFNIDEGTGIIGVTTSEHMKVVDIPLEEYLKQIVKEAREYGDSIFHKYELGGEIGWFPCGTAEVVLRWNQHREIIDILRKTSEEGMKGRDGRGEFWRGWFGRLYKTLTQGWWWTPPMQGTQSMRFQQAVCEFVREKLIFKNIKVDVRTYID